jgi:hypothetical protein
MSALQPYMIALSKPLDGNDKCLKADVTCHFISHAIQGMGGSMGTLSFGRLGSYGHHRGRHIHEPTDISISARGANGGVRDVSWDTQSWCELRLGVAKEVNGAGV